MYCLQWAREQYEENFVHQIKQLLHNFPAEQKTREGDPFWSGTKRCPHSVKFNLTNEFALMFVMSAARLRAEQFGIEAVLDAKVNVGLLDQIVVEEFKPKEGVKIAVTDSELRNAEAAATKNVSWDELVKQLPSENSIELKKINVSPVEFEKDDDANGHIDFVTACSNLRAENYEIAAADKFKTKLIAGKIIPAIATTTSIVAGLVCLELYKINEGHATLEFYKNAFLNLALPFFGFSEPIPPTKSKYNDKEFTLWDRFDVHGDITLRELIDSFKNDHQLEINMLSQNVSLLYSFFLNAAKKEERLNMKISEIVKNITKKEIPKHVQALVLEICVNDKDGEDVDVPFINYRLPARH
jgi:ubiquitin-activating enzyme E1